MILKGILNQKPSGLIFTAADFDITNWTLAGGASAFNPPGQPINKWWIGTGGPYKALLTIGKEYTIQINMSTTVQVSFYNDAGLATNLIGVHNGSPYTFVATDPNLYIHNVTAGGSMPTVLNITENG